MQSHLNPHLRFQNNARKAMEFYRTVFGGTLEFTTFGQLHASTDPSEDELIMHSILTADNGIAFMAADTPKRMEFTNGDTISMALSGENEAELRGYWDKLVTGAQITMPLEKAQWGDIFGMLTDKFGVHWMVDVTAPKVE